ncbi:GMC family oxidoreductase [Glutamicibacter sp. JL.03c]|uniref:GMC family oxidoreductase n=1 Tax=Glutamicibacter sp. JL.03c TaxID=2984842 RepID=UPI0021F6F392|nr:GMC family oxidoreductase [Glutamicibacter sp. JL.03c]UYQ77197.1 GMC family oxidoreductase [Glutamicibacter sp. JL.03c]
MGKVSVIVVGAGSAGSVVARRLIDAGADVTVFEAGGEDTNPAIHDLSRLGELWHSPDDWDYYTTPMEGTAGKKVHLPRGKVLGGSHALNATIWVRCAQQDFDGWAQDCGPEWAWDKVLPVYRDIEDFSGGGSAVHGTGGPIPVDNDYQLDEIHASIIKAAEESGVPFNPDYNSGTLDGVSKEQVNIVDGQRINTWKAYLKPVRGQATIITGAEVHSVIVEDGAVTGVNYRQDGQMHQLTADHVVLSAGALGSPQILLRSGIGPAAELQEAGVQAVHDLPGVGKNLHDHLLAPVIATTTTRDIPAPRQGVSVSQSHLFAKSREDLEIPDTQPIFFAVPMYSPGMEPVDGTAFTLHSGIVTPYSRGELTLSGPGLDDPVNIDLNALADRRDMEAFLFSIKQCRQMVQQDALAGAWGAQEIYPGPEVQDDAQLEEYIRNNAVTYHHQVGTCAMGIDGKAVVDPELKVRGLRGLRVIDASIMPKITTGNTNAPSILIGEQGARFMLNDLELEQTLNATSV